MRGATAHMAGRVRRGPDQQGRGRARPAVAISVRREPVDTSTRPGRVGALDGLRGLAVGAVLLYHSPFGFARGGYLGVSLFFTLSGFLITCLLLTRTRDGPRVPLRSFWARRARRLLPAAAIASAGGLLYGPPIPRPHPLRPLRRPILPTL